MATIPPPAQKSRINPLSRIPRNQRLVMAIRGSAGVGKSFFVRSMADAGIGRLCVFDMERKSRLLPGVGVKFDGLELEKPNELPEFIDWALNGEGKDQNYGCFALDSWAAYFGTKHSETISAVRDRTQDPLAQPSAEELAADQMVLQGVLRKLCMESGKSVVIVDQIPAKGKEQKEDNEVGRVLPMTASGLEYFVDVMVELSLQERDGDIKRVFQVIKSNTPAFEVGHEFEGDATFRDFLDFLLNHSSGQLPPAPPAGVAQELAIPQEEAPTPTLSVKELLEKAAELGFTRADVVTASRVYHQQTNIYHLKPEQILDLDMRMAARIKGRTESVAAGA